MTTYKKAKDEIENELLTWKGRNKITLARKRVILKRINTIIYNLELQANLWAKDELVRYYKQGVMQSVLNIDIIRSIPNAKIDWYKDGYYVITTGNKNGEYHFMIDIPYYQRDLLSKDRKQVFAGEIKNKWVSIKRGGKWVSYSELASNSQLFFADKSFSVIHKEAIQELLDETKTYIAESMRGLSKGVEGVISEALKEQMRGELALGKIQGESREQIKKRIKEKIKSSNVFGLKDRSGKVWNLDTYTEMLVRTTAVKAHNEGLAMQMLDYGMDLVQVTSHETSCSLCSPWQGRVLSITGNTKGYATLDDAKSSGLFHPNCRHSLSPYSRSLAN